MSRFFVKLKPAETYTHTHTHTHTCSPLLRIKQIGTICFAIFSILISAPSFADPDIASSASSADCKYNPLETYSGTSNLQAGWEANTIQLHWYNGDTEITSGVQTSCVYDGALTPPTTIPTKTGYTFKGWRVKQAAGCSFANQVCGLTGSQVNALTYNGGTGTPNLGYRNDSTIQYQYDWYDEHGNHNGSKYGLTEDYTWAVEFTNGGIARGIASCNNTGSIIDTIQENIMNGTMTEDQIEQVYMEAMAEYGTCNSSVFKPSGTFNRGSTGGQKCWCKMTSYTPSGGSACNIASSSWVYITDAGAAGWHEGCEGDCAYYCADMVAEDPSMYRPAIWGVAQ